MNALRIFSNIYVCSWGVLEYESHKASPLTISTLGNARVMWASSSVVQTYRSPHLWTIFISQQPLHTISLSNSRWSFLLCSDDYSKCIFWYRKWELSLKRNVAVLMELFSFIPPASVNRWWIRLIRFLPLPGIYWTLFSVQRGFILITMKCNFVIF